MGNPEIAGRLSKQIEVEQQYIHVYPNMTAAWARSDMYLISMYIITYVYTYRYSHMFMYPVWPYRHIYIPG